VREHELVGVCQRDCNYYDYLEAAAVQASLKRTIAMFHETYVFETFPDANYVYDVYVDKAFKVWIVGFKPFSSYHTDPLLVRWRELRRTDTSKKRNEENSSRKIIGNGNDKFDDADADDGDDEDEDDLHLSIPFRVVQEETNAKKSVVKSILNRLPADNVDLSDQGAIGRFIAMQEKERRAEVEEEAKGVSDR
jgi:hypothetical protein